jgi:hypothetical protein
VTLTKEHDRKGYHWIIHRDGKVPSVEAWWERKTTKLQGKNLMAEIFVIRQEDQAGRFASVVTLTLGQVYELIKTLNEAVENP